MERILFAPFEVNIAFHSEIIDFSAVRLLWLSGTLGVQQASDTTSQAFKPLGRKQRCLLFLLKNKTETENSAQGNLGFIQRVAYSSEEGLKCQEYIFSKQIHTVKGKVSPTVWVF